METYHGHVRTPADAIILFEACRIGLLPRVQRRLSEKERQSIRSGSVFVWDEREAGMRRWTDGKSWSASRVSGSFLTYREMEGKRGGSGMSHSSSSSVSRSVAKTPESMRGSDDDRNDTTDDGPDGYRYKPDGLTKQSFSITTSAGQHLHLISYYSRSHPSSATLQHPSTDPALRHVRPQKGLYPESTVNDQQNLPVVTRSPMPAPYSMTPHPITNYPPRSAAAAAAAAHVAANATHAAHPPSSYPPQYSWPPPLPPSSSLPAPPPTGQIPYSAAYFPPISASNGQVPPPHHPHQHPQAAAPLPPPPQHGVPPYDRPIHHGDTTMIPHVQSTTMPAPAPPVFARSPRMSEIHDPHPRSPSSYVPPSVDHRLASPRIPAHSLPPSNGMTTSAVHSPHSLNTVSSRSPPQPPSRYSQPPLMTTVSRPMEATPSSSSSGTTVPSIGAMINSAPSGPPSLHPSSSPSGPFYSDAPRLGPLPRTGRSPLVTTVDGPKDIPNEKIGFGGEDMRALRQLDRVFI